MTEFDPAERQATQAVITAVASAAGKSPLDLPPLAYTIDPDALDRLFTSAFIKGESTERTITFHYAERIVTVTGRGAVFVQSRDRALS